MATGNHSSVPEGFKEIPGYGGRYFINEHGDVWSVVKSCFMKQQWDEKHPYPWLLLKCDDGKYRTVCVHRIMARTWLGLPNGPIGTRKGEYCVNHKDGNKRNNSITNLEWITSEENLKHAWQTGLNNNKGDKSCCTKLTSDVVRFIRLKFINGLSLRQIASEYGLSISGIHDICRYRRWKHQDHDLLLPMTNRSQSIFIDQLLLTNNATSS